MAVSQANCNIEGSEKRVFFRRGTPAAPGIPFFDDNGGATNSGFYMDERGNNIYAVVDGVQVAALTNQPTVKIAILGASESARSAMAENPWPERLQDLLNQGGPNNVSIKNLGYHGATFFQANTSAFYGANTMVQECVAYQPDIVLVEFGGNDLLNVSDGRTLAQVKTDSDTLFNALRAGIPGVKIVYVYEKAYDSVNFATPGTTLKNKAVASQFMELTAAGVAAGFWSTEMLDVACSAPLKTKVDNLLQLDTYIVAQAKYDIKITMDFWKLQRLGVTLPDMAHHNVGGHQWMAASVYKQLKANATFQTFFPRLSVQIITEWQDPDAFWSAYLTASGDGFIRSATADVPGLNGADMNRFWGDQTMYSPEEFCYPSKGRVNIWPPTLAVQNSSEFEGMFRLLVRGGPPTQTAFLSIDGAAFLSSGEVTDTHGNIDTTIRVGIFGLTNAAHAFRFKIGTEVYGPFNITISAPWNESKVTPNATAVGFTASVTEVAGARHSTLKLTGALGAGANLTTPTAAQIIANIPNAYIGQTYRVRIINANAAAFAWTVVAGANVTLNGTLHTIAANSWREYEVKYTAANAVTFESIGVGTWS